MRKEIKNATVKEMEKLKEILKENEIPMGRYVNHEKTKEENAEEFMWDVLRLCSLHGDDPLYTKIFGYSEGLKTEYIILRDEDASFIECEYDGYDFPSWQKGLRKILS